MFRKIARYVAKGCRREITVEKRYILNDFFGVSSCTIYSIQSNIEHIGELKVKMLFQEAESKIFKNRLTETRILFSVVGTMLNKKLKLFIPKLVFRDQHIIRSRTPN